MTDTYSFTKIFVNEIQNVPHLHPDFTYMQIVSPCPFDEREQRLKNVLTS
jgi:hypothetical protein